ncbi:hypothetical protein [Breoghania sp.]|uniref:hypothetical protein n=1 Tax=Breoghania sp. TaxID=2065378 RepID=UPI00261CAFEF|nr:hypothetical protein [Breoghania sp.]MDJ0930925.1 hypothetical protein [Breoghania sp.]
MGLLHLIEDQVGAPEQNLAGFRQFCAAGIADEELNLEIVLEFLDLAAERGLGDPEPVCRAREALHLRPRRRNTATL